MHGNQGEGRDQECDQADDITKAEGTTWNRTTVDRQHWYAQMEGEGGVYNLQWKDNA